MRPARTLLLLALLLAGGCGGSKSPAPATASTAPTTTVTSVTTPQTIAKKLVDRGFSVGNLTPTETGTGLVAREAVETTIDDVPAYIYTFGNLEGTRTWAQMAASAGGIAVIGDMWAINPTSDSTTISSTLAEQIVAAIGGRVI